MRNHYQTLGLDMSATIQEIKKAYKLLASKLHPDVNNGNTFFNDRFKELNEAFEILSDESKRRIYDQQYSLWASQGRNANSARGSNDYTESFSQNAPAKNSVHNVNRQSEPSLLNNTTKKKRRLQFLTSIFVGLVIILGIVLVIHDQMTKSRLDNNMENYETVASQDPTISEADSTYSSNSKQKATGEVVALKPSKKDILDAMTEEDLRNAFSVEQTYTIGSTKKEVLRIQGDPHRVRKSEYFDEETWDYLGGSITFKKGRVYEYNNDGGFLKVRMSD